MQSSFSKSALLFICSLFFALTYLLEGSARAQTVDEIREARKKSEAAEKKAVDDAVSIAKEEFNKAYIQCEPNTYVTVNFVQGTKRGNELYDPLINFLEFDDVQGFTKAPTDIQFLKNPEGAAIRFQIKASKLRKLGFRSKTVETGTTTRYTFDYKGKPDWSDWSAFAPGQYVLMDLILVRRLPFAENEWELGKLDFRTDFQNWNGIRSSGKPEKWELRLPTCQEVKERTPSFNE